MKELMWKCFYFSEHDRAVTCEDKVIVAFVRPTHNQVSIHSKMDQGDIYES